jgi:hypothetical protein
MGFGWLYNIKGDWVIGISGFCNIVFCNIGFFQYQVITISGFCNMGYCYSSLGFLLYNVIAYRVFVHDSSGLYTTI